MSNRHIHLSQIDAEKLFGKGYEYKKMKDLSQPGQYACEECVSIKGPKGQIDGVRILGPYRKMTQVEVLLADTFKLGIKAPISLSGHLQGTPGVEIVGPMGSIQLEQGLIVAKRHLHITVAEAKDFGLEDGQTISVKAMGERGLVFDNVVVRATDDSALDMHIDTEEANAAGLGAGAWGEIIK
ncbi:TPA: phosphate propanoyltransferase [Patescibacteria group bacterium]|nr:phosphate propanoyltransferase [Candidatus Gracilibacteria bacterium]